MIRHRFRRAHICSTLLGDRLSPLSFGPTVAFAFEKLLVYQKSVDFADEVSRLTDQLAIRIPAPDSAPRSR
jgi:hypothetical protein